MYDILSRWWRSRKRYFYAFILLLPFCVPIWAGESGQKAGRVFYQKHPIKKTIRGRERDLKKLIAGGGSLLLFSFDQCRDRTWEQRSIAGTPLIIATTFESDKMYAFVETDEGNHSHECTLEKKIVNMITTLEHLLRDGIDIIIPYHIEEKSTFEKLWKKMKPKSAKPPKKKSPIFQSLGSTNFVKKVRRMLQDGIFFLTNKASDIQVVIYYDPQKKEGIGLDQEATNEIKAAAVERLKLPATIGNKTPEQIVEDSDDEYEDNPFLQRVTALPLKKVGICALCSASMAGAVAKGSSTLKKKEQKKKTKGKRKTNITKKKKKKSKPTPPKKKVVKEKKENRFYPFLPTRVI